MRLIMMVLCAATMLLMGNNAYAAGESKKEMDAKTLFENKCIQCHSLSWSKERKKTEAEWAGTVMRMKNVNGAPISDEEAKIIIDYLTSNYGGYGIHHHGMKGMEHK
ncbi:MAG: hypothetical protein C4538_05440 [Nitrospiraceae bacterium]|nr:MAG: hypothetical protein C4538_05440 [Nitrospiraceae bacterium]